MMDDVNEYRLSTLNRSDMENVLRMRREKMAMLRTPFLVTEEMQERFFDDVISNRQSNNRYFAVRTTRRACAFNQDSDFAGMVGIENIQWENRTGEISFLMFNFKDEIILDLLRVAFLELGLHTVTGECYMCSPDYDKWMEFVDSIEGAYTTRLPDRKFYHGKFHDALWFSISEKDIHLKPEAFS